MIKDCLYLILSIAFYAVAEWLVIYIIDDNSLYISLVLALLYAIEYILAYKFRSIYLWGIATVISLIMLIFGEYANYVFYSVFPWIQILTWSLDCLFRIPAFVGTFLLFAGYFSLNYMKKNKLGNWKAIENN